MWKSSPSPAAPRTGSAPGRRRSEGSPPARPEPRSRRHLRPRLGRQLRDRLRPTTPPAGSWPLPLRAPGQPPCLHDGTGPDSPPASPQARKPSPRSSDRSPIGTSAPSRSGVPDEHLSFLRSAGWPPGRAFRGFGVPEEQPLFLRNAGWCPWAPHSRESTTQDLMARRLLLKPTKVGIVVGDEVLQRARGHAARQVVAVRLAKECEQAGAIDRAVAEESAASWRARWPTSRDQRPRHRRGRRPHVSRGPRRPARAWSSSGDGSRTTPMMPDQAVGLVSLPASGAVSPAPCPAPFV